MHYDESLPPPDLALDVRRFWSLSDAPQENGRAPPRPVERVMNSNYKETSEGGLAVAVVLR